MTPARPHPLTTPRAAAVAGVLFALLFGAVIVLIRLALPEGAEPGSRWLVAGSTNIRVGAGLEAISSDVVDPAAHGVVATFGQMMLLAVSKTYALRMAAVFMISLATIWLKTGLMPRWLVGLTYLVALGLILASDITMWLVLAVPIWVLVVSVLLLVRAGVIDVDRDDDEQSAQSR